MSAATGGAAFPNDEIHENVYPFRHIAAAPGMTLRDYFAAKALQGFCAVPDMKIISSNLAIDAYSVADLMLLERSK